MNDGTAGGRPGGVSDSVVEPPDSGAAGASLSGSPQPILPPWVKRRKHRGPHRTTALQEPQPGHLVLSTGLRAPWKFFIAPAFVGVLIGLVGVINFAATGRTDGFAAAILFVVGAPISFLLFRRALRLHRLTLTPQAVGYTGLFGRTREVPRSQIARVLRVSVTLTLLTTTPIAYDLYLGADGRCLLRALIVYFDYGNLELFDHALGVPVDWHQGVPRARRIRKEIPHSLPWPMAHLWLFVWGSVIVFLVAYCSWLAATGR